MKWQKNILKPNGAVPFISELDELVFNPLTNLDFGMDLKHIDLEHPHYLYEVTVVDYNPQSMVPVKNKVELTD